MREYNFKIKNRNLKFPGNYWDFQSWFNGFIKRRNSFYSPDEVINILVNMKDGYEKNVIVINPTKKQIKHINFWLKKKIGSKNG